ncbi:MAG TPA: alpha/beta hydrolase [Solirubrobacteraceae bacterium]|jgi:pimeloyl-ACP methyl ester carboxylesterase|nr:alpha/beta hydrolase [Solirubrobacteraceae bacterium]
MSVRQRTLSVGGTQAPAIEAGPADAEEAVVFVHGNPGSHSDWTELVDAVGELGRAVAFDMPGFGKAKAPAGFGFDVPAYAEFIETARGELGIERAHLVLHDFGGPFGLFWGIQHADRWASLVLLNVGVMPGYQWHSMAKRWRTPVLGELTQAWIPRAAWRRIMQGNGPRRLPEQFVEKMYDDYDRETRRTVLKLYRATPDPGKTAEELGGAMRELHKPTLVVWGAKDPFIGVEFAERQREFFDVDDVVVLPNSGHWAFQDDPDAVREAVVGFLRARLSSAPGGVAAS